ncbi:PH domain-containing protein [Haloarcula salinisoli]|uniref:PH domain-containing protein n=1 Tax=Haloarcula salinisoli TaxID=2487746 RepID=A0A8J7YHZ3_9EURY|nr:PH domain-containing protein [Halomicroarcula salinisoli]MBX0286271.1 PH domain-containing protein [Halomicroarcula salinisoli]MBX0302241.1 PH domain-containing protein [Halomicroarcula salinisoli]
MARGMPAVWSTVFGLPIVVFGVLLFGFQSLLPLPAEPGTPAIVGAVIAAFGLFIIATGVYVHYVVAPTAPRMRDGEQVVDERDPAQRNALGQAVVGLPVLATGGYLLYFTALPLVYPTVAFAVGLYLFSTGLHRYWRNTLTTYFVTTQRVLEEYRFISLRRNEVPHSKVRAVEERRSAWDSLFGLGNVAVRSGSGGQLTVAVEEVYESGALAETIRDQVGPDASAAAETDTGPAGAPAERTEGSTNDG